MVVRSFKSLMVAAFSAIMLLMANVSAAQGDHHPAPHQAAEEGHAPKSELNVKEIVLGHIQDSHEWHFFTWNGHHVTAPLPMFLYSADKGFKFYMSSAFHHGEQPHDGFNIMTPEYIKKYRLDENKFFPGKLVRVNEDGSPITTARVYDFSITKNVLQMLLAAIAMLLIFRSVSKKYKANPNKAPTGLQNAMEPLITFVRDDIAKPNLGHKYERYMPFLLSVFFFIWINNMFGLIPGSANVTGNIAFTALLSLITFIIIIFSSNKHYWGHILNPPGVPLGVKFILVPVEVLGVFTKPFALMIRLFANMIAGHMIILSIITLIFIFAKMSTIAGWAFTPVSVGFTIFMYFLELLVAFIQAYIFTTLSALFIGQAYEGEHHHEEAHHH